MKPANPLRSADYEVRDISQAVALDLVRRYHYAKGGPNTGVFRHGLFERDGTEALGVAWWLPPTKIAALSVSSDWRRVICLTRLVVAPGLPTNAASFLLGRSLQLVRADGRWTTALTYADEGQGHTGAIYLATNWTPCGTNRGDAVWRDADGRHVARKSAGKTRTVSEMEALGYVRGDKTRKHKFVKPLVGASSVSNPNSVGTSGYPGGES